MKIEIGESLVYSWLRHVKHCQIVQLNWKPSPIWGKKEIVFTQDVEKIKNGFATSSLDIFKKNNSMEQFLQQAEIDALGISHQDNKLVLYFVDVAFHEGGLNYGPNDETVSRILKKYIRSYFIFQEYFDGFLEGKFYFLSPKVNDPIHKLLEEALEQLRKIFNDNNSSPNFHLVVNDDFDHEVLSPIIALSKDIADTNELFLRSVQLWKMFELEPKIAPTPVPAQPPKKLVTGIDKIGLYVRNSLDELIKNKLLDDKEIERLLTPDYSKTTFGLDFPFLRMQKDGIFDNKKRRRYYAVYRQINGNKYYFCSQWYEKHKNQFDIWFTEVMKKK